MARLPDWDARLFATLDRHADVVFALGRDDCLTFAAACVEAVTGEQPAAGEIGRYRTALGVRRRLKARGFGSIAEALAATFPEIGPAFAGRGDLGTVGSGAGETIVVGAGPRFVTLSPACGLVAVRPDQISRAFKVG